jgi:hypothetical protein
VYSYKFIVQQSSKLFEVFSICLDTFLTLVTRELLTLRSTVVLYKKKKKKKKKKTNKKKKKNPFIKARLWTLLNKTHCWVYLAFTLIRVKVVSLAVYVHVCNE